MLGALAPVLLARECFRQDVVAPAESETVGSPWSLADCTSLDFSCANLTGPAPAPCSNALQADEMASLTEALKEEAPKLTSLELRGNWVGPLAVAALSTALQQHPALEFLGLGSTAMGDVGGTALARRLLLQDAPPSLRRVDLSHNHLGDDFARSLAEALKAEESVLETLDLAWNGIGPRGGRYLGDALRVNDALLELRLQWNGLQDRGARALGEALGLNRVLAGLDLEHNAIKDAGGKALAAGLRNNSALRTLALEHNGLSHKVRDEVHAALQERPELPPLEPRAKRGEHEEAVYTRAEGEGENAEVEDEDVVSFDDEDEPAQKDEM
eukprot:Transcript_23337.p1 GENE.Transcript_23337~~Transcript_23337.p1  ORF type:complete len:341 (+),score=157.83 Transcript_23337:40-1023(+)